MRKIAAVAAVVAAAVLVGAGSLRAITFGQLDGNLHPQVGALVAEWRTPGKKEVLCSGSVIAPKVFLTAGHCTAFLESLDISDVWVTFDSTFDASKSTLIHGSYVTDPNYGYSGKGGASDPHDLAVVLLDTAAPAAPVQLPTRGLLDTLDLKSQTFTAVGYGTVREDKTKGQQPFFFDSTRRYALQSFLALEPAWLALSENPSTGDGGTCYGDSGGPHFLGGTTSNLQVSITVTGDTACRATDKTYRLDTQSARAFLGAYVTLP
jgi:secreted trypsin-like serine protease